MDAANIGSRKAVISVVEGRQLFQSPNLLAALYPVPFALALDAEQVLQHPPARARLEAVPFQS